MRKLIIFHFDNYKPKNLNKRIKTKEFRISIGWILCFFISILLVGLLNNYLYEGSLTALWLLPVIPAIGSYRYFTHLERKTEYFINDNKEYQEQLEKFLFAKLEIQNVSQLEIMIKSTIEERDNNIKEFGVAVPYIVMGTSLIALFSNKSEITIKELVLYVFLYFTAVFVVHVALKIFEPIFNLYADGLSTLINFMKQIQLDWLSEDKDSSSTIENVLQQESIEDKQIKFKEEKCTESHEVTTGEKDIKMI